MLRNAISPEELVQAIQAHDPDGNGIERVRSAAEITLQNFGNRGGLYNCETENCVLAHAWDANVEGVTFYRNGGVYPHAYKEVVHWFDSFEEDVDAAEAVLEMLPEAQVGAVEMENEVAVLV